MNEEEAKVRRLTDAECTAVSGGASTEELLASTLSGAAAGAAVGAPIGAAVLPPGGFAIGAAVGAFAGGFLGGMQYAVGELFEYCF